MVHLLKVLQMVNDKENLRRRHLDVVRLHQFLCRELPQDALDALFRGELGYRAIGYKIAGTNPASRAHLRIEAPFFGRLYDGMTSRSPAVLAFAPDFLRAHEPEIAIEIGRDLAPSEAPFDAAAIEAATRAVLPAIEIIGTYDPKKEGENFSIQLDRADYWVGVGARPSQTVGNIMTKARKKLAA